MDVIIEDKERGTRLAEAIKKSALSRAEVAEALGVTPQAIWKWCKTGKISRENLIHLSTLLNIDASYLSRGTTPIPMTANPVLIAPQKLSGVLRYLIREHGPEVVEIPIEQLSELIANEYNSLPD